MPRMKPGKNQGNIDVNAVPKANGDPDNELFPDTSGTQQLDEVLVTAPSRAKKWWDNMFDPNKMLENSSKFNPIAGLDQVIKIGGDNTVSVSSGGDSDPEVKKEFGDDFLYGSKRFNRLWSLYNEVKDQDGIENNPEYHRLIKKLTRKMPRTVKNLERNISNSVDMRNKINEKLGNAPMDLKTDDVVKNVKTRINKFIKDPFYTKPPEKEDNENEKQETNTGKNTVITTASRRGPYLAPQLGNDIKKSLKNFR